MVRKDVVGMRSESGQAVVREWSGSGKGVVRGGGKMWSQILNDK